MALDLIRATYNPDVLSCLANLSSDEVFTPPEVVNNVLDMLPQELFSNPDPLIHVLFSFLTQQRTNPGCRHLTFTLFLI